MPGYHSPRSPSSAHRWRKCYASIREEAGLPDSAGEEAIQGTVFHDYAADCVDLGIEPWGLIGDRFLAEDGKYREFSKEMANKMLYGLDLISARADAPGAILLVEQKLDLSPWLGPEEFGTSDACVISPMLSRITVFDWKWGAGVPVDPEWNDQAILYFLGCWHTFAKAIFEDYYTQENEGFNPNDPWEDEIEVEVIIEQPRAPGGGGVWRTTVGAMLAEGKRVKRDAEATRDPAAPHNPGEKQCQFCKAAAHNTCVARADYLAGLLDTSLDEIEEDFQVGLDMELVTRRALSPAARSQLILNRKLIEKWLQSLHDEAIEDAKRGLPTPGLKRVAGRSPPRGWADEDKAEIILSARFGDDAWNKKLRSPTMIEDEVGKVEYRTKFERLVAQGSPKPILVPEQDPREAMASTEELLDGLWDTVDNRTAEQLI